jgi:hypothetical protein
MIALRVFIAVFVAISLMTGCQRSTAERGTVNRPCGENRSCGDGLTCIEQVCRVDFITLLTQHAEQVCACSDHACVETREAELDRLLVPMDERVAYPSSEMQVALRKLSGCVTRIYTQ